jgi:hypothetical protein
MLYKQLYSVRYTLEIPYLFQQDFSMYQLAVSYHDVYEKSHNVFIQKISYQFDQHNICML